jgi:hypothetical protein
MSQKRRSVAALVRIPSCGMSRSRYRATGRTILRQVLKCEKDVSDLSVFDASKLACFE